MAQVAIAGHRIGSAGVKCMQAVASAAGEARVASGAISRIILVRVMVAFVGKKAGSDQESAGESNKR
jgi:hypothetical protein